MPSDSEHPITYDAAGRMNVYDHLAWYCGPALISSNRTTSRDHLEELARVANIVNQLDRWQAIGIHRAIQSGASLAEVASALGETAADVVARWTRWSRGQRHLWETSKVEDPTLARILRFDPAEHDHVEETLTAQLTHATA